MFHTPGCRNPSRDDSRQYQHHRLIAVFIGLFVSLVHQYSKKLLFLSCSVINIPQIGHSMAQKLTNKLPHVLAVTADPTIAQQLPDQLGQEFQVTVVQTANAALATLEETGNVQCIVSDHELPEVDAISLLETVRVQYPNFPFIIFTSEGSEAVASRAIHARVTDYLITDRFANQWDRVTELIKQAIEFHRAQSNLTGIEAQLQDILQALPDGVVILQDGSIESANQEACDILGIEDTADVVGRPLEDIIPADDTFFEDNLSAISKGETYINRIEVDSLRNSLGSAVELTTARIEWGQAPAVLLIIEDISQRKHAERGLARTNEQLRVLNRITRHDIRNDMSVIVGWSGELASHVDDEGQAILDRIQRTSKNVIGLTKTVRDFMDALGTDQTPDLEPISACEVLDAEVTKRRSMYPGTTFRVDDNFPDISVQANNLLSSVFRNILNNAVQHNHNDNPVVQVGCGTTDETVRISIADNGPGIPEGQKDAIFGRGQDGLDDPTSGIGLYLVDQLVDSYGGDVWVKDNEPTGSVFVVELNRVSGD
jgi:PAS domain S-box-containing protein